MADSARTTHFRFWLRLIRVIGVIVPLRLRAHQHRPRIGEKRQDVWRKPAAADPMGGLQSFNHRNFTVIPANIASDNTNSALFLNLGQTNVAGRTMLFTIRYIF